MVVVLEGGEWEFRFRAPRQQRDGGPARPGGLMMCDIFNAFRPHNHRPHNHRPHSRPITEGPFLPRGALHYSAAAESRALSG